MKWDSLRFIYYYILFIILLYNYIIILLLYSFINCNDRYDNKNSRSIIGQINPVSETFLQCIMVISRIKQYFFVWIVYYFRLKKLLKKLLWKSKYDLVFLHIIITAFSIIQRTVWKQFWNIRFASFTRKFYPSIYKVTF